MNKTQQVQDARYVRHIVCSHDYRPGGARLDAQVEVIYWLSELSTHEVTERWRGVRETWTGNSLAAALHEVFSRYLVPDRLTRARQSDCYKLMDYVVLVFRGE